jgi:hypothetical protein
VQGFDMMEDIRRQAERCPHRLSAPDNGAPQGAHGDGRDDDSIRPHHIDAAGT